MKQTVFALRNRSFFLPCHNQAGFFLCPGEVRLDWEIAKNPGFVLTKFPPICANGGRTLFFFAAPIRTTSTRSWITPNRRNMTTLRTAPPAAVATGIPGGICEKSTAAAFRCGLCVRKRIGRSHRGQTSWLIVQTYKLQFSLQRSL